MKKKGIAIFVIVSLLLSIGLPATAVSLTDIGNNPYRVAIEQMVELGVLSGRGGGIFSPADNLTRAEAAAVAVVLAGFDDQDIKKAETLPQAFTDVYAGMGNHEWALGCINLAAREGIIGGYGDGKYGPGDNLQMVQWASILIRILGHDSGNLVWPTGIDQLAAELGLTEGLVYVSNSNIRRDQMAKFSANAVYNVVRPDGSRILDLLQAPTEEKPQEGKDHQKDEPKDQKLESLNISLAFNPQILPQGGGKTSAITVTVTDQVGRPVEDAKVWFVVDAFEGDRVGDRRAQLSQTEIKTNASGKAFVTYTSLAGDDKKLISIAASASKDSIDKDGNYYSIMAANQAAQVSGVVRNPYNSLPIEGVHIHFMDSKTDRSIGFAVTDNQGRYSMPVPTGTYHLSFERPQMPIRDQITVNASSPGQNYIVDNNKGIMKGVVTGVSPGKMVMAMGPGFNRNSRDNWTLQADIQGDGSFVLALAPGTYELFIVGSPFPSKAGITVKNGQVTDIGSVRAR